MFFFAGNLARDFDQRLTFHPSHFVKLGAAEGPLLDRSIRELEMHSLVTPPPWQSSVFPPGCHESLAVVPDPTWGSYGSHSSLISFVIMLCTFAICQYLCMHSLLQRQMEGCEYHGKAVGCTGTITLPPPSPFLFLSFRC